MKLRNEKEDSNEKGNSMVHPQNYQDHQTVNQTTNQTVHQPQDNPIGLNGVEFLEYTSKHPEELELLFDKMGYAKVAHHKTKNVTLYRQHQINYILNKEPSSFAEEFQSQHGPSVCAAGFRVYDANKALKEAVERGGKPYEGHAHSFKAIYGIGDSLIYFIDGGTEKDIYAEEFEYIPGACDHHSDIGLTFMDHMTNNVPMGDMDKWYDFYVKVFNFRQIRYFDIVGQQTGLLSRAMRSPCENITIPINEPKDKKSQIQEYLEEYQGPGIQHIALHTNNIIQSVSLLKEKGISFLDVPDTYYEALPQRLPHLKEDMSKLQELKILADGDSEGYLLQIFTKNMIGPIFFEIIQRRGHDGFGEGNFQALFDAIEEDQRRRGYLK